MKKLVLILSLIFTNTAMAANIAECLPVSKFGAPNEVASKAFLNRDNDTVTVILENGKSVSGKLVRTINHGPTAVGFSPADAEATGFNVTVIVNDAKAFVLVSEYMSMGMAQQLLCR